MSAADELFNDLPDDEADKFISAFDHLSESSPDFRAQYAARRCFDALARRFGRPAAEEAFKYAPVPPEALPRKKGMGLLMLALHDQLKADPTVKNPTKRIERLFSGDGPLSDGAEPESVVRRLRRLQSKRRHEG